ncbi:hypothetical protein ACSX1A_20115 [Pontibacter sp. MBLB2868]|uniref:hypothetical protein n=1 Tax=Pontibacter sp. MBLB2868 TaxID=3451555 RepID=UPI003F74D197
MSKLRLYFLYHRTLMSFNLPFSLAASLTGFFFSQHVLIRVINNFSLCLMTGGFLLSLYFFEQRYSGQYYFYHNFGLSKIRLIIGSLLMNLAVVILLFFLKLYLYG